jgi:hypothetical protein
VLYAEQFDSRSYVGSAAFLSASECTEYTGCSIRKPPSLPQSKVMRNPTHYFFTAPLNLMNPITSNRDSGRVKT